MSFTTIQDRLRASWLAAGADSFLAGEDRDRCPYPNHPNASATWRMGWDEAARHRAAIAKWSA